MDNNEDIMNSPEIRDILSELKGNVHIPFEVLLADAEGKLSPDGHSKVVTHLSICDECRNTFKQVKDSLGRPKDGDEETSTASRISINPALNQKIELTATLNSKRDEIAKEIAQLLLPEVSWFCIEPAIEMYRDLLKSTGEAEGLQPQELQKAAFSSDSDEDSEDFEVITLVIRFVDYFCDSLLERCGSLRQVKQKLPEVIDNAWSVLDEVSVGQKSRDDILAITKKYLSKQSHK